MKLAAGKTLYWLCDPDWPGTTTQARLGRKCIRESAPEFGKWYVYAGNGGWWATERELQVEFSETCSRIFHAACLQDVIDRFAYNSAVVDAAERAFSTEPPPERVSIPMPVKYPVEWKKKELAIEGTIEI